MRALISLLEHVQKKTPPAKKGLYYNMITSSNKKFSLCKAMVMDALQYGIKPTARRFGTTPKTVKKWLRRFEKKSNAGVNVKYR